jgi:hypothetical protein
MRFSITINKNTTLGNKRLSITINKNTTLGIMISSITALYTAFIYRMLFMPSVVYAE